MGWVSSTADLLRKIDKLLGIEAKHSAAIETLRERVAKLERDREILIIETRAAAAQAASASASLHVADLARRLGALEERMRSDPPPSPRQRLPKP
jgi:hypothetical protein